MIIALAGRRIDAPNATIPRFPLKHVAAVRERLHAFFVDHKATVLICSAACGADLLALDVAGELGIWRRIALPFEQDRFRAISVTDRPGEWGMLFDRIIREVQAEGKFVILSEDSEDDALFATANKVILDEALLLAREKSHEQPEQVVEAVLVWDGLPRGEGDLTAHFAGEALARGLAIAEIATM
jgi:hypothetical protein